MTAPAVLLFEPPAVWEAGWRVASPAGEGSGSVSPRIEPGAPCGSRPAEGALGNRPPAAAAPDGAGAGSPAPRAPDPSRASAVELPEGAMPPVGRLPSPGEALLEGAPAVVGAL